MRREKGFGTLVSKGEGKPWMARWKYEGKVYYRSTGEINRNKALKELEKITRPFRENKQIDVLYNIEAKIKSAERNAKEKKIKTSVALDNIEDLYSGNLAVKDLNESSLTLYIRFYNCFLEWIKENRPSIGYMNEVDRKTAEEYMTYIAESKSTCFFNGTLALLRKIWDMFKEESGCEINPFGHIRRKKREISSRKELNTEELIRIFDRIKDDGEMLCLFSVGVYTGLRLGDSACLKWRDVDMFRRILSVVPEKTKKYTGRVSIPMHNSLFNMLAFRRELKKENDEYVMPEMAAMYRRGVLTRRIRNIFNDCGIKTCEKSGGKTKLLCGFHSLRHTFVSMNLNSGMNPLLIQKIVGHTSVDMTRHYFHSNENVMRNGIEKMPDLLGCEGYVDMNISDSDIDLLKSMYDKEKDGCLSDTIKRLVGYYKEYSGIIDVAG